VSKCLAASAKMPIAFDERATFERWEIHASTATWSFEITPVHTVHKCSKVCVF
jgi:hypothetical protein